MGSSIKIIVFLNEVLALAKNKDMTSQLPAPLLGHPHISIPAVQADEKHSSSGVFKLSKKDPRVAVVQSFFESDMGM